MAKPIVIQVEIDEKGAVRTAKRVTKGLNEINKAGKGAADGVKDTNNALTSLNKLLVGAGGIYAIQRMTRAIVSMGTAALNSSGEFERMTISLDTITKGRGVETFEKLNKWAIRMPVSTQAAVAGFTRMRAMGLEPTIEDMTTLVDTTSALGGSVETFNGIVLAMGQIATKGKLMSQEIRQLAERGIPAYEILNEELGITGEMLEKSGREAIDSGKAIEALMTGLSKRFAGQSDKIRDTWTGATTEMISNWVEFTRLLMDRGPFETAKKYMKELRDLGAKMAYAEKGAKSRRDAIAFMQGLGIQGDVVGITGDVTYSDEQIMNAARMLRAQREGLTLAKDMADAEERRTKASKERLKVIIEENNITERQLDRNIYKSKSLQAEFGRNVEREKGLRKSLKDVTAKDLEEQKRVREVMNKAVRDELDDRLERERKIAEEQAKMTEERKQQIIDIGNTWGSMFEMAAARGGNFAANLRNQLLAVAQSLAIRSAVSGIASMATGGTFGVGAGAILGEFFGVGKAAPSNTVASVPPVAGKASTTNTFMTEMNFSGAEKVAMGSENDNALAGRINRLIEDRKIKVA